MVRGEASSIVRARVNAYRICDEKVYFTRMLHHILF